MKSRAWGDRDGASRPVPNCVGVSVVPAVTTAITTYEALLTGLTWNGFDVANRPTFLTYSFDITASPSAGPSDPFLASFQPLSAAEQAMARDALKAWADVSGLTLFEVPAGQGDIRFGTYDFRLGPAEIEEEHAFAIFPIVADYSDGAFDNDLGGDIFIDIGHVTYPVLLQQVGIALGLKAPSDGTPTLDSSVDDLAHTVMSLNTAGPAPTGLGPLDIAAVQFVYGQANSDGTQVASWSWDAGLRQLTQTGSGGNDDIAGVATADRISAGAGDDYVLSRAGDDRIDGEDGADTLAGGDGRDSLSGGAGADVIDGDDGDDTVAGGEGNDDLFGLAGADTLSGEGGDDSLTGGSGPNLLSGGSGNDTFFVYDGASTVDGGDGYDEIWLIPASSAGASLSYASFTSAGGSFTGIEATVIFGDVNADTLVGGDLPDSLVGDSGADSMSGGGADDELFGGSGADTLMGGDGADYLDGSSGDDIIMPGQGADEINAGTGNDTVDFSGETEGLNLVINTSRFTSAGLETMFGVENIVGTAFSDNIFGDIGGNRLFGGLGDDTIGGSDGINYLRGDDGSDSLLGGTGFDDANGNMGNDTVSTGAGEDYCVGGKDADSLSGGADYDLVYGNLGNDTCTGDDGNDIVRGGQDNDVVNGGNGDDFVSGDKGDDTMTGGAGADVFHTFGDAGIDRVTDFSLAQGDRVQLDPGTQFTVSQAGADTIINMTGGGQMILVGVSMSTLTPGWIFGA